METIATEIDMRKMALLGGLIVIAILGLTGFAWVSTQAASRLSRLQAAIAQQTGLNFAAANAHASLWPSPAFVLSGATIAAANGPPLVSAEELRVTTGWLGMLSSSAPAKHITLVAPQVNLLIDQKGQANWTGAAPMLLGLPVHIEEGTVAFLDERSGQALKISNVGASIGTPEAGSLALQGFAVWNRQRFELKSYVKSIGRLMEDGSPADIVFTAPAITTSFSGRLTTAKGFAAAGRIDAGIPDLRTLLRWVGATVPEGRGLQNISVSGAVDALPQSVEIGDASVSMDGMQGRGLLGFEVSAQAPTMRGTLEIDRLDLDVYRPKPGVPLSFAALQGFDATFDIKTAKVIHATTDLGPSRFTGTLKAGKLDAKLSELRLFTGTGTGRIALDGTAKIPAGLVEFNGEHIDLGRFLGHFGPFATITGVGNLSLSLAASGLTAEEMISNLKGFARADVATGSFAGLDAVKTFDAATRAVITGWGAPDVMTPFDTLSLSASLVDGVAKVSELAISAPGYRASALGEVDLLRQAVDLKISPERAASDGSFIGLPVPLIVRGRWNTPRIYPDMPGIDDDPVAAFAALKQLGVSQPAAGAN